MGAPTNVYGAFQPQVYSMEVMRYLRMNLGMAGRVHRGYNLDNSPQSKGNIINIPVPSSFTIQDEPSSVQSLAAGTVPISLAYWRGIVYAIPDNEAAMTLDQVIENHISPACYEIAKDVDTKLCALYKDVPYSYGTPGTALTGLFSVALVAKKMNDLYIPDDGQRAFMIDSTANAALLGQSNFTANAGNPGDSTRAFRSGSMGPVFGMELFMNQNTPSHTAGILSAAASTIKISATAAGVRTGKVYGTSITDNSTLLVGDILSVSTSTGRSYVITAIASTGTDQSVAISFYPSITAADIGACVFLRGAATITPTYVNNLAFHRAAFALATAPLKTPTSNVVWARTISFDGLTLRIMRYYDTTYKQECMSIDFLYGVKTLMPEMAVRVFG